jgi:hypothetical protein
MRFTRIKNNVRIKENYSKITIVVKILKMAEIKIIVRMSKKYWDL